MAKNNKKHGKVVSVKEPAVEATQIAKAEYKALKKALKKADNKKLKNDKPSSKDSMSFANTDATSWRDMVSDASKQRSVSADTLKGSFDSLNQQKSKANLSMVNQHQLSVASILLSMATGIAILFALAMVFLPGGMDAVPAMGGVLQAVAPMQTAQIVFLLDVLFPITFGAGFAVLATSFQTRGNRPIVRLVLTALLFAVLADFSENALVLKALTGGETYAVQWPLTVIKYAMLGFSAVLLSTIIRSQGALGKLSLIFLRFVFPVSIAILVSGLGGRLVGDIIGATFPFGLLLLAIYARTLSFS